jgi:hypothetical protein
VDIMGEIEVIHGERNLLGTFTSLEHGSAEQA